MRPLGRPSTDDQKRWVNLKSTKNAKKAIDDAIANGKQPAELESEDFAKAWREEKWKKALSKAQDGLCVWCTREVDKGGSYGRIDHIRPKTEVSRDVTIELRRNEERIRHYWPQPALRPGYYWLAYDPDNLAFCCEQCNVKKSTFWPVDPWRDPTAWKPPVAHGQEKDLILDPFDLAFDPFQHFRFHKLGDILAKPNDTRAEATILLVGLDEEHLKKDRRDVFEEIEIKLGPVVRSLSSGQPEREDLLRIGRFVDRCAWSSPHAAFYRTALRKLLHDKGWSWGDFLASCARFGASTNIPEPPADSWIE